MDRTMLRSSHQPGVNLNHPRRNNAVSPHQTSIPTRTRNLPVFQLALLALLLLLCAVGIVSSTAQSLPQDSAAQIKPHEREFKDGLPEHVPIKVKVRNLNHEKWADNLEVEVKNTGEKPIYFLFLIITLPDVRSDGNRVMSFQLLYGREELVDFTAPIRSDDIPIRPGETQVLKIPEQFSQGWERFAARRNLPKTEPRKIQIRLGELNFGDGTGFMGTDGTRMGISRQWSSKHSNAKAEKQTLMAAKPYLSRPPNLSREASPFFLPATFLPVKMFMAEPAIFSPVMAPTAVDTCGCQGGTCYPLKYSRGACCGYSVLIAVQASCTDLANHVGACHAVEDEEFPCPGDGPCIGGALI
ncbi:MAG: hypothetical protein ABR554_02145, partial [Pyrinomonadaceae bacterium]